MTRMFSTLSMAVLGLTVLLVGCSSEKAELVDTGRADAGISTVTLTVEGMTCGGCALAVRQTLKEVDGVVDANVSYDAKRADVLYHHEVVEPATMMEAIGAAGFSVALIENDGAGS